MEKDAAERVPEILGTAFDRTQSAVTDVVQQSLDLVVSYAFSVVGAICILVVGFILAGLLSRWMRRSLMKLRHVDLTLAAFLSNLVKYAIWVLVIVMVLGQFGVQTTSIIAVLGAAGLAIGLALQGTLANIAAGIMLLVLRPFRVGEYIEAGSVAGTVQEIGLFTTELKAANGLFIMSPNSQIWNTAVTNYSRNPIRRFEFTVGIGYDDDMATARAELLAIATSDPRVLDDPAPVTFVSSLDDSSVGIGLFCWLPVADFLVISRDLTERAKRQFDDAGITIPYPQTEITQRIVDDRRSKPTATPQG